jgi:hypothetical protein
VEGVRGVRPAIVGLAFAALALPAAAPAARVLARERAPTAVDAFGHAVIWSSYGPLGKYHLKVLRHGHVRRLHVRPRPVQFDVDLGPDANGRPVAVYSRCRREPDDGGGFYAAYDLGRGCRLYRYSFDTGREQRLRIPRRPGASDFSPVIWRDTLVFVRVFTHRKGVRGDYPYLYEVRLPDGTPRRLAGGTRGVYEDEFRGGPGPVGLDLRGHELAFAWGDSQDSCAGEITRGFFADRVELWLGPVGRPPKLVDFGCEDGDGGLHPPKGPYDIRHVSFDHRKLWSVQKRASGTAFRAVDVATGAVANVPISFYTSGLAVRRGTAYYARVRCYDCDDTRVVRDRGILRRQR